MANEIKPMSYFDVEQNKKLNLETQTSVNKTIDELKVSVFSDIEYFESAESDAGEKISEDERTELTFWSFTIDKLLGKIPAEVKQACAEKLNELKDLFTKICQKNNTIELNGNNIKYKNGKTEILNKTTEKSKATQAANQAYEPEETDAKPAADWNAYIKKQAYAYMKAVEKAAKELENPNLTPVERAEVMAEKSKLMSEYTDGIEDASDMKLFNDYCDEYRKDKNVRAIQEGSKVYTERFGDAMGEVVSPGYSKRRKKI